MIIQTPPYLKPGDTIGIVCPAGYMAFEKASECVRILQEVWGYTDADNANLVELAIRRLRTKIETDASSPVRLVTVRGIGYKFVTQQQSRTVGRSLPE